MSKNEQNALKINKILKGAIVATFSTVIGITLLALILKTANLSERAIKSVNQFIKIISVFLGSLITIRESKGLVKGLILGATYCFIVSLIFKLLGGSRIGFLSFLLELIFCAIIGVISGIISVNLKNK